MASSSEYDAAARERFIRAVEEADVRSVTELIAIMPELLEFKDHEGNTVLHIAVGKPPIDRANPYQRRQVVEMLASKAVHLLQSRNNAHETPRDLANRLGHWSIACVLDMSDELRSNER